MTALLGLLVVASVAFPWASYEASTVIDGQPMVAGEHDASGFRGPFGMGGMLIFGLSALGVTAAAMVVFTRGRGAGLTAGRWLAYAGVLFALSVYFLLRAWHFDRFEVVQSEQTVVWTKTANRYGLMMALTFAIPASLFAFVGAYRSWRGTGVSKQGIGT